MLVHSTEYVDSVLCFICRPEANDKFLRLLQIMKLVEVIKTEQTSQEVFDRAYAWVGEIGKVAVSCGDTPVRYSSLHLLCGDFPSVSLIW